MAEMSFWSEFATRFPTTPGALAGDLAWTIGSAFLFSALLASESAGQPRHQSRMQWTDGGMLIMGVCAVAVGFVGAAFGLLPLLLDVPLNANPVYLVLASLHLAPGAIYLALWKMRDRLLMPEWLKLFSWLVPTIFLGLLYFRVAHVGADFGILFIPAFIGIATLASLATLLLLLMCRPLHANSRGGA